MYQTYAVSAKET